MMRAMGERGRGDGLRSLSEFSSEWMDTGFGDAFILGVDHRTRFCERLCMVFSRSTRTCLCLYHLPFTSYLLPFLFSSRHVMISSIPSCYHALFCAAIMPVFMISYLTLSFFCRFRFFLVSSFFLLFL